MDQTEIANVGMSTSSLMGALVALMLLWLGGYCIYTVIRLNRTYELFPSKILYLANARAQDCKDDLGFIRFMSPRLIIFGILCILVAGLRIILSFTQLIRVPDWFNSLGMILIYLPVIVWYILIINRAYKKFW